MIYGKWLIILPKSSFKGEIVTDVTHICQTNRDVFLYFCAAATKKNGYIGCIFLFQSYYIGDHSYFLVQNGYLQTILTGSAIWIKGSVTQYSMGTGY